MNREVIDAAMDIQGGSGICLGPQNYIGKSYQSIPVSITVEGANIMTRNLIIFGQGAIRNHPYAFDEMEAIRNGNREKFARLLGKHIKHFVNVTARSLAHGLTGGYLSRVKKDTFTQRNVTVRRTTQHINRFSASFAFVTDVAMMLLGGALKRKERVSARLGDILSYLYMLSAIRHDRVRNNDDFGTGHLYDWSEEFLLYKLQEAFYGLFDNFPIKGIGTMMRLFVFPYGRTFKKPSDTLDAAVANILRTPNGARETLGDGIFISDNPEDQTHKLQHAFYAAGIYEDVAKKSKSFDAHENTFEGKAEDAVCHWAISNEHAAIAIRQHTLRDEIIQVDDFEEL
jgi:acyl-CoA dehydrogenase